jgi:hypothetical protein
MMVISNETKLVERVPADDIKKILDKLQWS